MKKILLTGDRPTGKLHIGHYVGSLKNRVEMQNSGEYDPYIMIADKQAFTDNYRNPQKIHDSLIEVALDYLSVGIDPEKSNIFVQTGIPELSELTEYFLNLVSIGRLKRNPTVKNEIKQKDFGEHIPAGFFVYPISQAADISLFKAEVVPVGDDQIPMIEQTREIVRTFNSYYGNNNQILVEPKAILPDKGKGRIPGIDGASKMSKSLNNSIYLSDDEDILWKKIKSMYTDPKHININDKGNVDGNMVFTYLDIFDNDKDYVNELKEHYQNGGLGDMKIKKYLFEVLNKEFTPIREQRNIYANDKEQVLNILKKGTEKAKEQAEINIKEIRNAMGINYW